MSALFIIQDHNRPIGRLNLNNCHFAAQKMADKPGAVKVLKNRVDGVIGEMPVHRVKLYLDILMREE